jgi:hypothetical protein
VHKAARISDAAHGGQVLVSQATRDLVGDRVRELGEYRLKDLTAPERLFQLSDGALPPLRTLRQTNLSVQPGPLLGRRAELAELSELAVINRLITLTGPGGSGKTRLALALAARLSDGCREGVWWVALAAPPTQDWLRERSRRAWVRGVSCETTSWGSEALLLLDNLEQVLDSAPLIAELLDCRS